MPTKINANRVKDCFIEWKETSEEEAPQQCFVDHYDPVIHTLFLEYFEGMTYELMYDLQCKLKGDVHRKLVVGAIKRRKFD